MGLTDSYVKFLHPFGPPVTIHNTIWIGYQNNHYIGLIPIDPPPLLSTGYSLPPPSPLTSISSAHAVLPSDSLPPPPPPLVHNLLLPEPWDRSCTLEFIQQSPTSRKDIVKDIVVKAMVATGHSEPSHYPSLNVSPCLEDFQEMARFFELNIGVIGTSQVQLLLTSNPMSTRPVFINRDDTTTRLHLRPVPLWPRGLLVRDDMGWI
jgi:hypothetical protein